MIDICNDDANLKQKLTSLLSIHHINTQVYISTVHLLPKSVTVVDFSAAYPSFQR